MNLCDYNTIRDLLARHGFHFSKSMGQNFLIDPEVPRRIAEASGADAGCGVLEIGPGIGPLTAELAQRAGKVVAVELDRALLPVLAETMAPYPNVEVVPGDVLKLDLTAIAVFHTEEVQGVHSSGPAVRPGQHRSRIIAVPHSHQPEGLRHPAGLRRLSSGPGLLRGCAAGIGPRTGGDVPSGAGCQQTDTEIQAQKQAPFFHEASPPLPV